ncbi:hypothetical protein KP509_05G063100 [Ceratopteris richardii]|uniref:starch synthase n=1 Tax=Ceratopteris richardii TaxID=49495 RepID=A0A8T2UYZ0_CERRI|nr:hypothetical protein KP509_05G063100 [Ceratopteris richardii]
MNNESVHEKPPNEEEYAVSSENLGAPDEIQHSNSDIDTDEIFNRVIEDLTNIVKNTEEKILSFSELRTQSLAGLEQVQKGNDELQTRLNVLKLQLEMKLIARDLENSKLRFLEQEVEILEKKLSGTLDTINALSNDNSVNYTMLAEYMETLGLEAANQAAADARREKFETKNEVLQKKMSFLESELADASEALGTSQQMEKHENSLSADDLQTSRSEKRKSPERIQPASFDSSLQLRNISSKIDLPNDVYELVALLAELKRENQVYREAIAENEMLGAQYQLLEQKLVDLERELKSKVEFHKFEMKALCSSLDKLVERRDAHSGWSKADSLKREFRNNIVLSVDRWLLEEKLSLSEASALREMTWQNQPKISDVFFSLKGQSDDVIVAGLLKLLNPRKRQRMHIVHIAAEMAPVAKVGGLADVVTGLGRAFQKENHLVEIVIPKYDCMDYSKISKLTAVEADLDSFFDGCIFKNKVWTGIVEGLPVYFIEPHHPSRLFWRGKIYGENDDFKRFTYFSRAALQFILQTEKRPDIIHCHDWHSAVIAPLYWEIYVPQGLDSARIAFTCHNFEYQGRENPAALTSCGLDPKRMHRADRMQDNFIHNQINLLKGAIIFSNIVTTVSPTYAEEVQSSEGGKGLHLTLMAQNHKVFGILNGIDTDLWNPATDLHIAQQYSTNDIDGKAVNKAALRSVLMLSGTGLDSERPIVGCVTRLVPGKGVHLIRHAIFHTLERGGQFVLLGSSPVDEIQVSCH